MDDGGNLRVPSEGSIPIRFAQKSGSQLFRKSCIIGAKCRLNIRAAR